MAAYLASGIGGRDVNYMRLIKLMYLTDRASMARYGEPISYDPMYSMDHGLVLSESLNAVKSDLREQYEPWGKYFTPRPSESDYSIGLRKLVSRGEMDFLSDTDIALLNEALAQFGKMDQWALRQYLHDHCKEWKDPDGSRIPVDDEELLKILGRSQEEAAITAQSLQSERLMDRVVRRR